MQFNAYPALLLNADFRPMSLFPLSLISWQEAVSDIVCGRVVAVAEYDRVARSPSRQVRLPSVVALTRYCRTRHRVAFTRYNVFLRDRFSCQYCLERYAPSELTFDHVVPRSRGGETSWANVVTACSRCNALKGASLGMRPATVPRVPTTRELLAIRRGMPAGHLHESWLDYLYWDSELAT